MASRRKPLDDARRRVKEKLNAIDEQKKFIQNSVDQITSGVKDAANSLLTEGNKTKFFQKYRAVSQELEKCLDDLLLISATISSLEDNEDEEEESDEEDEKPPDDIASTTCDEEHSPVTSNSKHQEIKAKASPADEKPSLVQLPTDHAKTPINTESNTTSCFSSEVKTDTIIELTDDEVSAETKDLIVFTNESPVFCGNETRKHSPSTIHTLQCNEGNIFPTADRAMENTTQSSGLLSLDQSYVTKTSTSLHPSEVCKENTDLMKPHDSNKEQGSNQTIEIVDKPVDSTAYVNDLFMFSPSSNVSSETEHVDASSRRASFEEIDLTLDSNSKNMSTKTEYVPNSMPPSPVRLERIGFCEYKSHENEAAIKTENDNADGYIESVSPPHETRVSDAHEHITTVSKKANSFITKDCKISSSNQMPVTQSFQVEKVTDNAAKSLISVGDVMEEVFRDDTTCKSADIRGPHIPAFEIPSDKCVEVTVKEIVSPKDFWIQKASDDLDLLMEKMCYYFSKCAKTGDKGGMKELPPVGHVCCGRYTVDDVWYRVLVTAVSRENLHAHVLYVDEGNDESLSLSRLRELDEKFARLPCQALHVQLRGLELRKDVKLNEVNDWFKRRVSGETIEAVVNEDDAEIKPVPIDLYIRPHSPSSVSDLGRQKLEYNIHEMLIREGFAVRALSPKSMGTSSDVSPPSTPSEQSSVVKSESVSSEVTSGFHDAPSPIPDVNSQHSGCYGNGMIPRVAAPVISVDSDGSLYMLVSHVVNPGEFYVHLISRDAGLLDELMTDMNQTYQGLESEISKPCSFSPRVGDFCCARFSADGNWYRGLVLQVSSSSVIERVEDSGEKTSSLAVEVFYIDFGNIEQVNIGDLRELLPQFMLVPAQVVRCSLADVNPSIKQVECDSDVFDVDMTSEEDAGSKVRSRRRPRKFRIHKRKPSRQTKAIAIAAGDEDSGEELLPGDLKTGDIDTLELLPEVEKNDLSNRLRSSISDDIAKSYRAPSVFSDTAVELFEKVVSGIEETSLTPSWSESATEYFKTLTLNAQKLVGYVVPWDSEMLNNVINYSQGGECSLPNLGPVLKLNLYDVSNDVDVFINAAMVKAQYATSSSIKDHEDKVVAEEASSTVSENAIKEFETLRQEDSLSVVRVHHHEISPLAETSISSPPPELDPSLPSSPLSPTLELLDAWNPMSHDYQSFRNAYNVDTDNLDVAITGYEESRGRICRFYRTKHGCFRGSKCPDKHIEQDVTNQVVIYGSPASVLKMPHTGAWVLVKVTAIYNPAHFWVQMPYGIENVATQLIKSRSGGETSGEENLKEFDNLMEQMTKFYSKIFKRQRSVVPPAEGELVVVRSSTDNEWYRGQVCKEKDTIYEILLVDFGNVEWIDRSNICPIMPQFLHLPFQSVECYLANISPNSESWSEESKEHFKSLTNEKLLFCQILSVINKTMFVNLFQSGDGESRSITEDMINSGHAKEAKLKLFHPHDLRSFQSNKSLIAHPG